MDTQLLHQLFLGTLEADQNVRKQAERQLKEMEKIPGFLGACLDIIIGSQDNPSVQKSAAIYMKNKVIRYWQVSEDDDESYRALAVDPDEKPVFRERLVPMVISTSSAIRPLVVATLSSIVAVDFPKQWPEFFDLCMKLLNGSDIESLYAGLLCFTELCRAYRWKTNKDRADFSKIIQTAFPIVLSIGNNLLHESSPIAGVMLRFVLKIYKFATYHDLPLELQEPEALVGWGTLHLSVIKAPLPQSVLSLDEEERSHSEWVKSKKWAFANLRRLYSRYGSSRLDDKNYPEFRSVFNKSFVPEVLTVYLQQIEAWINGSVWLSQQCLYHLMGFLEKALTQKTARKLLDPHIEAIISHVVFPLLCPSDDLIELFEDSPEEYVHRFYDIYEDGCTADSAGLSFLLVAVEKRKSVVLAPTLQFVNQKCEECAKAPADVQLAKQKEAVLRMMGTISHVLLAKNSPVKTLMEQFLVSFVFPDFGSPCGFLRARALDTACRFADTEFADPRHVPQLLDGALKGLGDEHVPVQLNAALLLQPLIRRSETRDLLATHVPQIMHRLLQLSAGIDFDALSGVMEELVEVFSEQLAPFALELGSTLAGQALRLISETAEKQQQLLEDDDQILTVGALDDDKEMAALGLLRTITTLLLSLDAAPETVLQLQAVLMPLVATVLREGLLQFFVEVLEIIEDVLFILRRVPADMWPVLQQLHDCFAEYAEDSIDSVAPALHNYIVFGRADLVEDPAKVALVADFFRIVMSPESDGALGASDRAVACELVPTMILTLRGAVAQHLESFLSAVAYRLETDGKKLEANVKYQTALVEIVAAAFVHDAAATIRFLDTSGKTEQFFKLWFTVISEHLQRVFDYKLTLLGLMALVADQRVEQIGGEPLAAVLPQLVQQVETVVARLPGALEELEKTRKKYESGEFDGLGDDWNYDEEWNDKDEFDDDDVQEEAESNAYLEFLGNEGAKLQEKGFNYFDVDDEEFEEDPLLVTPLDDVNIFTSFKDFLSVLQSKNPARYQSFTGSLSADGVQAFEKAVQLADAAGSGQ